MWGKQLAAILAIYTGKGVAPEVNLGEHISCMPLPSIRVDSFCNLEKVISLGRYTLYKTRHNFDKNSYVISFINQIYSFDVSHNCSHYTVVSCQKNF